MKVKLTKIQSSHNKVRTDEVNGESDNLPEIGKRFVLLGEALVKADGNMRIVYTTSVSELTNISDKSMEFKTQNSTYRLDILE